MLIAVSSGVHAPRSRPIALLSFLVVAYFVFQAPAWCAAENRDGTLCRRNASSLLFGCSYRQHKWQKPKFMFIGSLGCALGYTLPAARATLLVLPENVPAVAANRSWGWYTIGRLQPFQDAPVYEAMVLELAPRLKN